MAKYIEFCRSERCIVATEDIQRVGERLMLLAKGDVDDEMSGATAQAVVEDARSHSSPLHRYIFGLSDAVLIERGRLRLAREVVESVRIVVSERGADRKTAPAFVAVQFSGQVPSEDPDLRGRDQGGRFSSESPRRYLPIGAALENEKARAQVLAEARRSMESWIARYSAFAYLAGTVAQVQAAIDGFPEP